MGHLSLISIISELNNEFQQSHWLSGSLYTVFTSLGGEYKVKQNGRTCAGTGDLNTGNMC